MSNGEGYRIGSVKIENIDEGFVSSLGIQFDLVGKTASISEPGFESGIPVFFENPEQVLKDNIIPSLVVVRDTVDFHVNRPYNLWTKEYRVPAPDSTAILVADMTGASSYVFKRMAKPCDLSYSVQFYHRNRLTAQRFVQALWMKFMPIWSQYVTVYDSLGISRFYSVFVENVAKLDEIASVVQRFPVMAFTIRIEAELDIENEIEQSGSIITSLLKLTRDTL
jgi:hypothetical protein